jgi:hypothetical protein
MALHRDIYWVGKQWAVTGHGIQACNQKQRSQFDIEGSRLWEDGVQEAVRAQVWVNRDDFDNAVEIARKYFPEPPRKSPPPEQRPSGSKPVRALPAPEQHHSPGKPVPASPSAKPNPATFDLRIEGARAKWLASWRIRQHPKAGE